MSLVGASVDAVVSRSWKNRSVFERDSIDSLRTMNRASS
jgi:hypothetical protein